MHDRKHHASTDIDKHCVIFDTEDENKFEYTTIHNAFCEVVNRLLEQFLADLGAYCPPQKQRQGS